MIIEKLRIENFFTFEEVDLDLGADLFFISGENRDEQSATSNGSGKSLLCQSIAWCLFDDIIRSTQIKKDDVIGTSAAYVLVDLTLDKDGQKIRVVRTRKHPNLGSKSYVWVDGEEISDHKNTDALIEQVLGLNSKTIYHAAYSDPGKEPIVNMTPAKMRETVSEILGSERFTEYQKKINDLVSKVYKPTLEAENRMLQILNDNKTKLLEKLNDFQKAKENWDEKRKKNLHEWTEGIKKSESSVVEYTEKIKDKEKYQQKLDELDEKLKDLRTLNQFAKEIDAKIRKTSSEIKEIETKKTKAESESSNLEKVLNNIITNPTGLCNYCGNALSNSKHIDSIIKKHGDDKNVILVKIAGFDADIAKLNVELNNYEKDKENNSHKMKNFEDLLDKKTKISLYIDQLNRIENSIKIEENNISKYTKLIEQAESEVLSDPTQMISSQIIDIEKNEIDSVGKIKLAKEKIDQCKILSETLTDMRTGVFNDFIKDLYGEIQECLDDLTEGDYSVDYDMRNEELQFVFSNISKKDKFLHYSAFSKGEQKRIAKAVSTALESVMNIGFVIDDEACVYVDPAGIKAMLDFIVRRNEGKTLLFVGLTTEVEDYFKGKTNFHVIKENGKSRVEVRTM